MSTMLCSHKTCFCREIMIIIPTSLLTLNMSLVTRKPLFRVSDQGRLKPACSATETSQRLEISDIETRDIILSRK